MERVKIAELKAQLFKHLRAVARGAEIEVTDRGRPIARIVPVGDPLRVRFIPPARPFAEVRSIRCRPVRWRVPAVEILLQDRRKR